MPERSVKAESFEKVRELVDFMNLRKLTKDDIFAILDRDELILIYLG